MAGVVQAEGYTRAEADQGAVLVPLGPVSRVMKFTKLRYRISGLPVVDAQGQLKGILTNRDLRFCSEYDRPHADFMTKDRLVTAPVGTTLDEAKSLLHRHRIEKLLVVDDEGNLKGLITVKDIKKAQEYPDACKDRFGRLRVGAAVGVSEDVLERCAALIERQVDLLC